MRACIFSPTRTAMQQGRGRTGMWVVEFEQESARQLDPLMGWTSSRDTRQQRLEFATQEAALAYCEKRGLEYSLRAPQQRRVRRRPMRTISAGTGSPVKRPCRP